MIWAQFDTFVRVLHVFILAFLTHFSAQYSQSKKYACAKDLTFKRSDYYLLILITSNLLNLGLVHGRGTEHPMIGN